MKLWAYNANSFVWPSRMTEWGPDYEMYVDSDGSPSGPYILVADLGLTRDDVEFLLSIGGTDGRERVAESLAARIEALLPPEVK